MAATQLTADLHPLLTEYVIKKLQKNRLTTVYSFVKVEAEQLLKITNLPAESIVLVKNHLIDQFAGRCQNAQSYPWQPAPSPLSTGVPSLDALLQGGGLLPGHIYELCGESGTGKTLLSLTMASNVVKQPGSMAYFIDTKCDFSGRKVQQILDSDDRKLSEQELGHAMARTVEELAAGRYVDEGTNLKLLIIDSLPSLWYLYQDAQSSVEPLGLLTKLICSLRKLAAQRAVAVVLINLTVRVVEGMTEGKRKLCPNGNYSALGRYWESAPGTRLLLERHEHHAGSSARYHTVQVWKSNYLRSGERVIVRMTESGDR
ncbi:AGAP006164-PA [Anopheles gambiae str. PEST]|uniref:AGAP006164-PA n=1 Tax=Anopheles gambiae TaxID=7165 RepID=A7UU35_ANOGA|nr:AGAP006164-PA [Anopheles gambiae str. PEST]